MKTKWTKRIGSLILAAVIALSSGVTTFAVNAGDKPKKSDIQLVAEPLSKEYKEYVASGGKGAAVSSLNLNYLGESYAKQRSKLRTNSLLPKQYDLRDYGLISPVRNQDAYGTCWTFSALGSAESDLIRQFPSISLSNIHLAWFSNYGSEEEEFGWYKYKGGEPDPFNAGGNDSMAVGTMAAWKGAVSSNTVPYDWETVDESLRYRSDYHLQDAYYMTNGHFFSDEAAITDPDTKTIKQILMNDGAVSIGYAARNETAYYNPETSAFYSDTFTAVDHAVLIAGWDDNYSKNNFKEGCQPKNDGAWLIRNSWGVDWGDDGYFWLSYEDKNIEYGCFYNMEAADNYTHNYQYDTLGWCSSISAVDIEAHPSADSRSAYMSNVFTTEETEQLEAISLYTTDAGTSYEISVYKGLTDPADPTSGTKLTKAQSGKEPYAGYHTIELDEPVLVKKGEKFSVVVKLTNPEYIYPIPVEFCPMPIEKEMAEFMGNGGESYLSIDGNDWKDAAGVMEDDKENGIRYYITNVCIKAFTNPVSAVSFSLMEGPVALGTELELSAPGGDAIYYTTDGTTPSNGSAKYTAPIIIDKGMTIKAIAIRDGVSGAIKEKTYTKADSELVSLLLEQAEKTIQFDLSHQSGNRYEFSTHVSNGTETVRAQPQGADTITVNGKPIKSSEWSEPIPLKAGENTSIHISSDGTGKNKTDYVLSVYRSVLTYDFEKETVTYDEGKYTLHTGDGTTIHSGDSITPYIQENYERELSLLKGNINCTEYVPTRQIAHISPIDFINEHTQIMYGNWNEVATKPDMSDAVKCDGNYISLTPGQNMYIRKPSTDIAFASKVVMLEVPDRPSMPEHPGIDYQTMMTKTAIPDTVGYAFTEDGSDLKMGTGEKIALTPGTTLYLIVAPTDHSFASEVREVPISAVQATPIAPEVEESTSTTVTLKSVTGAEYRLGSGNWQVSPVFKGLNPNTEYTFFVRIAATDTAPASEAASSVIFTGDIPTVNPSDYSFEVKYVDIHGDPTPIGGMQFFDSTGKVSREDIPMPYGYQAANIATNPSDEWLNPTALEFIDGVWKVTNPVVTIEVEKQACVKVVFKTEGKAVLEEVGYEDYYGEIREGLVSVQAPDGYKIVGNDQYAVNVTRDEDGRLVADPTEVTIIVKKIEAEKPQEPSKPEKPTTPTQQLKPEKPTTPTQPSESNDKNNPQTGDSSNLLLWFIVMVASSGTLSVLLIKRSRIAKCFKECRSRSHFG